MSPKGKLMRTVVMANPTRIFDDYKEISGVARAAIFANPAQGEKVMKLSLRADLLACLAGEITLELDSVTPPKPEWRAILKANDPKHLQQTLSSLLKAAQFRAEEFEEAGTTSSTVEVSHRQKPLKNRDPALDCDW